MTVMPQVLRDSSIITWRNLTNIRRIPDALVGSTIQPIMFVLLFAYVFGGSLGGGDYREWLIGGIFAQTVAFNVIFTTLGLANDLQKGIIDRFRSLPMSRSAVLVGRTVADLGLNAISIAVMALTGLVVGWRINSSFSEAVGGFLVLLLFAYAISWLMAVVGLLVRTPEVVQNASFIVIFPLTFVASTFVPLETFPSVLRTFAEWNPVSAVAQAARELFGNFPAGAPVPDAWSLQNPVLYTVVWTAVILAVFVPLSVRLYQRTATR